MLYHPTVEKLAELRLMGMHAGLLEQQDLTDIEALTESTGAGHTVHGDFLSARVIDDEQCR